MAIWNPVVQKTIKKLIGNQATVLVQSKTNFEIKGNELMYARSITKRRKIMESVSAEVVPKSNHVAKTQKKQDIDRLPTMHYGEDWS